MTNSAAQQTNSPADEHPRVQGAPLRDLGKHVGALVYLVLAAALLAWVTWDAFWVKLITFHPGSDYWEHAGVMRALLDDPFHPSNPHVVYSAPSPRFVPLFVGAALLARAFGLDAIGAMGVAAVLNTLLFLAGTYAFFRVYFRSRVAPLVGLFVLFASWWDGWHFSNVYQLKIYFSVVGYPSTTALGATMLLFALATSELRRAHERPVALALLSFGFAFVLITHPLTAMMTLSGGILLAATLPRVSLRARFLVAATVLVGLALAALWPYFSPYEVILGGPKDEPTWIDQSIQSAVQGSGGDEDHKFYNRKGLMNTLGLALLGFPVGLYLVLRGQFFIPLGILSMLTPFIANMYVPLPLGHRFVLLAIFYLQVAVVWLLLRCLPPRWTLPKGLVAASVYWAPALLVVGILGYFADHNLEAARGRFAYTERRFRSADSPYVRLSRRIAELAGPNSVVLADALTSWPIPAFGPKVVALHHPNPLVFDDAERTARVRRFFNGRARDPERLRTLQHYGVTHVVVKRNREGTLGRFLSRRAARRALPSGYVLYALKSE